MPKNTKILKKGIESTSNNNFMRNNVSLGLLSYNLKNKLIN